MSSFIRKNYNFSNKYIKPFSQSISYIKEEHNSTIDDLINKKTLEYNTSN